MLRNPLRVKLGGFRYIKCTPNNMKKSRYSSYNDRVRILLYYAYLMNVFLHCRVQEI